MVLVSETGEAVGARGQADLGSVPCRLNATPLVRINETHVGQSSCDPVHTRAYNFFVRVDGVACRSE